MGNLTAISVLMCRSFTRVLETQVMDLRGVSHTFTRDAFGSCEECFAWFTLYGQGSFEIVVGVAASADLTHPHVLAELRCDLRNDQTFTDVVRVSGRPYDLRDYTILIEVNGKVVTAWPFSITEQHHGSSQ